MGCDSLSRQVLKDQHRAQKRVAPGFLYDGITTRTMPPKKRIHGLWPFLLMILVGIILLQTPWLKHRLSWRVDLLTTYVRGVIQTPGPVPTPRARSAAPSAGQTPEPRMDFPLVPTSSPISSENTHKTPTALPQVVVSPTPIPEKVELTPPSWEKQDWNNCGPAALAMYLRYYGWEGDQFDISAIIKPVRADRNVNVEELDYYVRNYAGWLKTIYRVGGDLELIQRLLAAGFPVLVEASFYFEGAYWPNDDLWAAHYLLVTGYDQERGTFTVQDTFKGPDQILDETTLDAYWQPFNRVFTLIYLPQQEEQVRDLLGLAWDVDVNRQLALDVARREMETAPENVFAWFNLGTNLVYFERYAEAAEAYDQARRLGWPQRMLRYQFGPFFAYFHSGRIEDLLALTEYALQRTPNSEEAHLWRGWALYRLGDRQGAIAEFQAALDARPGYPDARYALDFVTGS